MNGNNLDQLDKQDSLGSVKDQNRIKHEVEDLVRIEETIDYLTKDEITIRDQLLGLNEMYNGNQLRMDLHMKFGHHMPREWVKKAKNNPIYEGCITIFDSNYPKKLRKDKYRPFVILKKDFDKYNIKTKKKEK